jgi:hypothetical protein
MTTMFSCVHNLPLSFSLSLREEINKNEESMCVKANFNVSNRQAVI